jgi:hypothetical protein
MSIPSCIRQTLQWALLVGDFFLIVPNQQLITIHRNRHRKFIYKDILAKMAAIVHSYKLNQQKNRAPSSTMAFILWGNMLTSLKRLT